MDTKLKLVLLFLFSLAIEITVIAVYYYWFNTYFADSIVAHTLALESGVIPSAERIDFENDGWVHVARFESTMSQIRLIVGIIVGLIITWILVTKGVSAAIARRAHTFSSNIHLSRALYLVIFSVVMTMMYFPLSISDYATRLLRGTSFPTVDTVIFTILSNAILSSLFLVLTFVPFYWIMDRFPKMWWVIGAGFMSIFILFTAYISPVIIDPLFYILAPLEDSELKTKILDLADTAGISIDDRIYVSDVSALTYEGNAVISGLWQTQRITLDDTLIKFYSPAEISFLVAHELGHYVLRHLWYDIVLLAVFAFISFGILALLLTWFIKKHSSLVGAHRINDIVLFPLVGTILAFLSLILAPVSSVVSRNLEHQADAYALALTHDPQAGIDSFKKTAYQNFVDPRPPKLLQFWFGTHPTVQERIEYLESKK